jgi:hypothetical protein
VAFAAHVAAATATSDGYIVTADLDTQPAGKVRPRFATSQKTIRPADFYQVGAQAAGVIPGRNQPQHPSHPRSPSRLSNLGMPISVRRR